MASNQPETGLLAVIEKDMRELMADLIAQSQELQDCKDRSKEETKNILLAFLEVSDSFHTLRRVLIRKKSDPGKISKSWVKAFHKACREFEGALRLCGLQEIRAVPGEPVLPGEHRVERYIKNSRRKDGTINEEMKKGYYFRGELLRTAAVKAVKNEQGV